MNRILVLGASGFLGTYLVDELLKAKYDIIASDLIPSKYYDQRIFQKCDILNDDDLEKLFKNKIDIVFNLAGMASLDKAVENPEMTFQLNIIGNIKILEQCKKHNIKRFVYASSAYAMSDKGSFYGISKLSSEKIIEEYYKRFGLKFSIIRYGSVYGDRAFENNYIINLIREVLETGEINHDGSGEEIREYIHAADAAKLSRQVIEGSEFENEHLILTGVERMKRVDLFKMIKEILNKDIKINLNESGYKHHYAQTPYSFQPELSKKLVANPYIDMGQGLLECIKYVHNEINK